MFSGWGSECMYVCLNKILIYTLYRQCSRSTFVPDNNTGKTLTSNKTSYKVLSPYYELGNTFWSFPYTHEAGTNISPTSQMRKLKIKFELKLRKVKRSSGLKHSPVCVYSRHAQVLKTGPGKLWDGHMEKNHYAAIQAMLCKTTYYYIPSIFLH